MVMIKTMGFKWQQQKQKQQQTTFARSFRQEKTTTNKSH
jgi:hypothetical protein